MIKLFLSALLLGLPLTAQDWAVKRLEKSSRHQEWVQVKRGNRVIHCFVVYPEVKEKATAVIVIHENKGLTDWVRLVADQVAEAGHIAIAPDLLSGAGPNGGKTSDFGGQDGATAALYNLPADQVTADLQAVQDYVSKLPACNGKVASAGFCWGGTQSFRFATNSKDLKAALVFYGTGPESGGDIRRIPCSVYGFYAGNDSRVNSTVAKSKELMQSTGKKFEPVTYDGAGHGFMRAGDDPTANEANRKAMQAGWVRMKEILSKL